MLDEGQCQVEVEVRGGGNQDSRLCSSRQLVYGILAMVRCLSDAYFTLLHYGLAGLFVCSAYLQPGLNILVDRFDLVVGQLISSAPQMWLLLHKKLLTSF